MRNPPTEFNSCIDWDDPFATPLSTAQKNRG